MENLTVGQLAQKAALEKDMGNACFKSGDFCKALEHYSAGMVCDPRSPILPSNRAMVYLKLNRYEEAKIDCDKALELDPSYVKAYYRRGLALGSLGSLNAAKTDFEQVLALEPANKDAVRELAKIIQILKQQLPTAEQSRILPQAQNSPIFPVEKPLSEQSAVPLKRIKIKDVCTPEPSIDTRENGAFVNDSLPVQSRSEVPRIPPVPKSALHFHTAWRHLNNHPSLLTQYFKAIPPACYASIFHDSFESDDLSDILQLCRHHLAQDPDVEIGSILMGLCDIGRFSTIAMLMSHQDRLNVSELLKNLESKNELSQEDLSRLNSVFELI